ncbi:MAG TPA: alpha/beta hydrolase [Actinocrinis sp.]
MEQALTELTIPVGGHRHTALAAGPADGEFALLLHGWPEFADSWRAVLPALGAAGYRAVAVDQRGYAVGARPPDVADYALEHVVADALAFADSQGARRFHLVAHDWGGMAAWALAAAHPDRLHSLNVLATPHPAALQHAAATDEDQYRRLDYVRYFRRPAGTAEQTLLADGARRLRRVYGDGVPDDLVEANLRRLAEPGALTATLNWYRALDGGLGAPAGRISTPTLFVWGDQDVALGRTAALGTAEHVDGPYRFVPLEGAGHWLPEEEPETVTRLLLDHLRSARAAGPGG